MGALIAMDEHGGVLLFDRERLFTGLNVLRFKKGICDKENKTESDAPYVDPLGFKRHVISLPLKGISLL